MSERYEQRKPRGLADRAFRSTVRGESTAFGFSIMVTVTFGAVQDQHGSPTRDDLVLYALGAVTAFVLLEAVASRGFHESLPEHDSNVVALGTALNLLSVIAAVAAGMLLSAILATDLAWLLCPLAAATVYLLAESTELALAERVQHRRGNVAASRVTDP